MKKTLVLLLMLTFVVGVGSAQAISIPTGPLTFHWTNWENLVLEEGDTLSGVFRLDELLDGNSDVVWSHGDGGEELTGVFGGLTVSSFTDFGPVGFSPADSYMFTGGSLQVYLDNSPDFDPINTSTITDGSLWLDLDFVTGVDAFNPTATLSSMLTVMGTDPEGKPAFNGSGSALLDVVGGSAADTFDTNTFARQDGSGQMADMKMSNTFYILEPFGNLKDGYPVWSKDPLGAYAIPEPTSMLLLGSGLLGFVGLRRKKRT